jgi:hypothetical protein
MNTIAKLATPVLVAIVLGACQTGVETAASTPRADYSLTDTRPGTFSSRSPGRPIPLDQLRDLPDRDVARLLGRPALDRVDGAVRTQRYHSDGCTLFVHLSQQGSDWRVRHAEAYDPKLRTIPADACAGSVAAQKGTA